MASTRRYALKLSGNLSLQQAASVCEEVHGAVTDHDRVAIDGAGMSEVDLSIVQILVAAGKTAKAAGKEVSVRFRSGDALDRLLRRAGFLDPDGMALTPESGPWAHKAG